MWIKERRKLKRFCTECKQLFLENPKLRGKGPKCDQCFPGVHLNNLEAWEVYQHYSNPMGADSGAILNLCKEMEVQEPMKVLEKILDLMGAIEAN